MSAPTLDKVYPDVTAALADLHDGAVIAVGGFGLCGNPEACIRAVAASGAKQLTIVSNNCGNQGKGLAVLLQNRQVAKVVCSFVGGNPDLEEQMLAGEVTVELNPQGTLAERMRAGGAGIEAFFTPTGAGTVVAEGKDTRTNQRSSLYSRNRIAHRLRHRTRCPRRCARQPSVLSHRPKL